VGTYRRVGHVEPVVEFEEGELEERLVELEEGEHDPKVHVRGRHLRERVRDDPGDGLPAHLGLEIHAFDRDEDLGQSVRAGHVVLPLQGQLPTSLRSRRLHGPVRRQSREEVDEGEGVIEVSQRVVEAGVPLPDQVVEGVLRGRRLPLLGQGFVAARHCLAHLLHEGLVIISGDNNIRRVHVKA
jgi:hypothetical protein